VGDDELGFLRRVVDCTPAALMIVDDTGCVTYVNHAAEELFGYTFDEVHGRSFVDFIDVEWNPIALESVVSAMAAEGLRDSMLFRVFPKSGAPLIVEVTANAQLQDPHIAGLLAYVRPWDEQWLLDRVLEAIAGDAPLVTTLELLAQVMRRGVLAADGAVLHDGGEDGFRQVVASSVLSERQRGSVPVVDAPWDLARKLGEPVQLDVADLADEHLRHDAAERGHQACWAFPVAAGDGRASSVPGCLVLWRSVAGPLVDETQTLSLERLTRLTGLVLQRARAAAELRHAAHHDPLTGLANRGRFFELLDEALHPRRGPTGRPVGVLYVDLDRFKAVNDEHGHGAGDRTIIEVASRLAAVVGERGEVARLGGDELAAICREVSSASDLELLAERIIGAVGEPIDVGVAEVSVGASVGFAGALPGTCSPDDLVDAADRALFEAKRAGKGTWRAGSVVPPGSAEAPQDTTIRHRR
jgi:diguanylate cyclase (GGDEF)-like protein/PAS domain S-box-containing protein